MNIEFKLNTARAYFTTTLLAALLVCVCVLSGQNATKVSSVGGDLLFVSQDRGSVEKQIASYIERQIHIKADVGVKVSDTSDVYLRYTIDPGDVPPVTLTIDTQPSNYSSDKSRVSEQVICFRAAFVMPEHTKSPEMRRRILEFNNERMRKLWFPGRICLDKDGDLAIESYVNIPGENIPVHAEMARDVLSRMVSAWRDYYTDLSKTIPLSPKK